MYYEGEEYLRIPEVTKQYGIQRQVLDRRRARGQLVGYHVGGDARAIWYKRADIEELMKPVPVSSDPTPASA